jgi:hypothetical protein
MESIASAVSDRPLPVSSAGRRTVFPLSVQAVVAAQVCDVVLAGAGTLVARVASHCYLDGSVPDECGWVASDESHLADCSVCPAGPAA